MSHLDHARFRLDLVMNHRYVGGPTGWNPDVNGEVTALTVKGGTGACEKISWKLKRLQPLWCDGVERRPPTTDERSRRWAVSSVWGH